MKVLRVAVCDDDDSIRAYLMDLVLHTEPGSAVDGYAAAGMLLQSGKEYDVVLMDIRMEGMDGMEAAGRLRENQPEEGPIIIFITALEKYVFSAFDVRAFHYLLKPVDEEKFREVFRRAASECAARRSSRYLYLHTRNMHRVVAENEIYYIESVKRKAVICTQKEKIEIYATMEELEEKLGDSFFRCHRSYFVNMEKIEKFTKNAIQMKNGDGLLLARTKYAGFVQAYLRFLHREMM